MNWLNCYGLAVIAIIMIPNIIYAAIHKKGKLKAISLSVIPSCMFLFSGIVLGSIPLIVFAVIFAVSHIFISCKKLVLN